jgi:demethylmenaquinone methyltransferase/2-methoxy-6-polyprenyl-1,4-benzoquinol methylase
VLESLDLEEHLASPAIKQRYVRAMFDVIAPRYDRFTRWFSFGMDAGWKQELLALAADAAPEAPVALDLACGTGDLTVGLVGAVPSGRVIGVDVSWEMLRQAALRSSNRQRSHVWCAGDMCDLPFPNASVDLVTAGYAVRNASSWTRALDEIVRVLRPGGLALTLEFFKPANALWRRTFLLYLSLAGRLYGWMWHRVPAVYGYVGPSVAHFVTESEFARALEARGLEVVTTRPKVLGGISIHLARKARAS